MFELTTDCNMSAELWDLLYNKKSLNRSLSTLDCCSSCDVMLFVASCDDDCKIVHVELRDPEMSMPTIVSQCPVHVMLKVLPVTLTFDVE